MRYEITVQATVPITYTLQVETSNKNIDVLLGECEKERCIENVKYTLQQNDCKIISQERVEEFGDIEISEYEEVD